MDCTSVPKKEEGVLPSVHVVLMHWEPAAELTPLPMSTMEERVPLSG